MNHPLENQRITICIATHQRPALLEKLLHSLATDKHDFTTTVLVVDNDSDGSAKSTVQEVSSRGTMDIRYLIEPEPGIAAARNAAINSVPKDTWAVVFIDDDEWVPSGWLSALIHCLQTCGADVVTGPVKSELPKDTPQWMVRGEFLELEREQHTGPYGFLPATNNTAVKIAALAKLRGQYFDSSFGLTGGSDSELFSRMRDAGATFWWCEDAVVYEHIPRSRLSVRWIWRRGVRSGNVLARLMLRKRSRAHVLVAGLARLAYGLVMTVGALATGKGIRYRDSIYVMRGFGFIGACFNRLIREYDRAVPAKQSSL